MCFILNNLRNACYFSREDLVKEWARYVVKDWARYVADIQNFLCFVDRASRHNCAKKDQLDAQLILSIFRQHLHVSGISRPIIRRYNRMHTKVGTYYWNSNPTRTTDIHQKRVISTNCCMHTVVPPDDGPRYARNM